jgi:hypothetical protein
VHEKSRGAQRYRRTVETGWVTFELPGVLRPKVVEWETGKPGGGQSLASWRAHRAGPAQTGRIPCRRIRLSSSSLTGGSSADHSSASSLK